MGPPLYMRSVADRNVVIRFMPIEICVKWKKKGEIHWRSYRQKGVDSKGVEIDNEEEKAKNWARNKWREEENWK